jgi:hypothetical protein
VGKPAPGGNIIAHERLKEKGLAELEKISAGDKRIEGPENILLREETHAVYHSCSSNL